MLKDSHHYQSVINRWTGKMSQIQSCLSDCFLFRKKTFPLKIFKNLYYLVELGAIELNPEHNRLNNIL